MQSVGNDIIDLRAINTQRSNDSRFYTKILSVSEMALYRRPEYAHISFEHFLWLLWSIKESGYKYLKRGIPDLVFSPLKIIIQSIDLPADTAVKYFNSGQWEGDVTGEDCYKGSCIFENNTIYFKSKFYAELIATVVSEDENFEHTRWGIQTIEYADTDHQSKKVRSFFLKRLNAFIPDNDLRIEKDTAGYPLIYSGTKELKFPVSFAHHAHFIAYSFLLNSYSSMNA